MRRQTRLGRFVATYGWRAYAIPVLAVLTVIVLVDALRTGGSTPEATAAGDAAAASGDV
ncbi:membrane protein, partial [Rhodococcus rhodochrous]